MLTPKHEADLTSSGLTPRQMDIAGHFSADQDTARELAGYIVSGLILNYCDPSGKPYLKKDGQRFYRIKPDWGDRKTDDSPKYLSPKGEGCRPYFSRLYPDWEKATKSTKIDLWETEGEKKGDCGCANGLAVIDFGGVDGWVDSCDRNGDKKLQTSRQLPELDVVDYRNRKVYQCFDSDIIEKSLVQVALAKRAYTLTQQGASPYLVLLPNEIDGSKNGLDDFVVRHGIDALKLLAKEACLTPYKVKKQQDSEAGEKTTHSLTLSEPEPHVQAVMAFTVLKDAWAYRPLIGWYEWQGTHWKLSTLEEFEEALMRFMDAQNWKKRNSGIITSVVRQLKSRLMVKDNLWSPFGKISFINGTFDAVSDTFKPSHNPVDRITQLRPYKFDLKAQCPNWLNFIYEAMKRDSDRVNLIQAIFRYAVLPRRKDRKAEIEKSFDFFGQKGTGKGTTLDVLTRLVGADNIGSASMETFKNAVGLGQLLDKDLAVDYDASGFLGNIGAYNKVVSNEPVEVKKLYKDTCTVRLGVSVVRAYNAFISVPDGSEGLDRRLTVIPFNHQPESVDTNLSQKLERELSGIFAWCYSISHEEMKRRIMMAGEISAIAAMSIERFEANNPEFRFLIEVFPDGKESIKANDLYLSYREWCNYNQHHPKSNVKFASIVQMFGCKRSNKTGGCFYYTIPRMSTFDIPSHLGIVKRQLGDSSRDSSNPDIETNRDSWGQFEHENQKEIEQGQIDSQLKYVEGIPPQPSTSIPNHYLARDIAISSIPLSVSTLPKTEKFQIGDRVVWMDAVITPALRKGVWVIKGIHDDYFDICKEDDISFSKRVELKNLQRAIC
ncbi:phage/plasmid primase, P4 family [Pseudanabaena sp. ABRG5-3]|uniref:phage/plasmid primase, P4 family n=1 Tax=Pseudanabaena sp. ABRG5-3 TaxID=685565 RepID=UPI000DC7396C|nr:phage/plasmid primase, P4 family [Pseudanabaena sp. ABRG5-3]BBC24591.1 phage/plasmid primase, P4 family [Pseudanabaena sp. ABRG5-3]